MKKHYINEKVNEYLKTTRIDNVDIISKSDNSEKIKSNIINILEFEHKGKHTINFNLNIKSKIPVKVFEKTI